MKRLILLCGCMVCLFLTSCAHQEGKILVLYSQDSESTFVYDEYDNFYVLENGAAVPIEQHFECSPAITLFPVNSSFHLQYVSTGKYFGSLDDVRAYCSCLESNGYELSVFSTNPHISTVYAESSESDVKLFVTDDGFVRIYAVDTYGVGVVPPYINNETALK